MISKHGDIQNFQEAPSVLVVDDDRVTRNTLIKVLSKSGYEVREAENGQTALDLFREQTPDIILMDVMMPIMDGYTTCNEVRKLADHQSVPIIMLTGLNDMESIDQAFDSGATDFITKPINWTLLVKRVRYSLRTRAMGFALRRNEERLKKAQRIAKLAYWEYDLVHDNLLCSDELFEMLEVPPTVQGDSLENFMRYVHPDDIEDVRIRIQRAIDENKPYRLDHRLLKSTGEEIYVQQQGELQVSEHQSVRLVGTLQDITERKKAEQLIEYQAYYDQLTGLPNRKLLSERLRHALSIASQQDNQAAVLFAGIDRFKVVNDMLGHAQGDVVLQQVGERLQELDSEVTTVARFGADVFALLVEGIRNISAVDALIQQIQQEVCAPFNLGNEDFFITCSIGISLFPMDCEDDECLLKSADAAMYKAKEEGTGKYCYYTSDINADAHRRLAMEKDLRGAEQRGEMVVHYQPQVDVGTRQIISMEALIRWQHPQKGMISPFEFIGVAEESGLILPIGEWVLRTACQQVRTWEKEGYGKLRVGVNLSAKQFADQDLLSLVKQVLDETSIDPDCLDLEVTESIAMEDMQGCINTLAAIRELGVHTSMDDFGTGYSSLSYLQQMPLNTLKIDRAFIKDISDEGENGEIARAIIAMAHSLGMHVIAEGVETEGHFEFLKRHSCDTIQGFLFSPPVPADKFVSLLEDSRAAAS